MSMPLELRRMVDPGGSRGRLRSKVPGAASAIGGKGCLSSWHPQGAERPLLE